MQRNFDATIWRIFSSAANPIRPTRNEKSRKGKDKEIVVFYPLLFSSVAVLFWGTSCSAMLCEIVNQFILRRGNILNAKHLPPKLMQVVCCPLSPLQEQLYRHFLRSSAFKNLMKKANANVLSSITALKKLCNHPSLIFDEKGVTNTKLPGFDKCEGFFAEYAASNHAR